MVPLRRLALACCIAISSAAGASADDKKPLVGSVKNQSPKDKIAHVVLTPDMVKKLPPLTLSTSPVLQYAETNLALDGKTTTTWQMSPPDHVRIDQDVPVILRFFESGKVGAKIGTGKIRFDVNSDPGFDPQHLRGYAEAVDVEGQYELTHDFLQSMYKGLGGKLEPGQSRQLYIRMYVSTPVAKPAPGGASSTLGPPSNGLTIIAETAAK